jgi:hypothetical protein
VGRLRALNKKVGEAEFKMLLADLTSELGDAKLEAANLKIEMATARERIKALEAEADRKGNAEPEIHDGAYVFGDASRHYCTGCWDTGGRKILLIEQHPPFNVFGKWTCPSCKQHMGKGRG